MTLHDVRLLSDYAKQYPSTRALVATCASALGVTLPSPRIKGPQPGHITSLEQARAFAARGNAAMRNPNG